jgi:hypothetical protein
MIRVHYIYIYIYILYNMYMFKNSIMKPLKIVHSGGREGD